MILWFSKIQIPSSQSINTNFTSAKETITSLLRVCYKEDFGGPLRVIQRRQTLLGLSSRSIIFTNMKEKPVFKTSITSLTKTFRLMKAQRKRRLKLFNSNSQRNPESLRLLCRLMTRRSSQMQTNIIMMSTLKRWKIMKKCKSFATD